jgi:GNAT superfamily N-acetyltransferase
LEVLTRRRRVTGSRVALRSLTGGATYEIVRSADDAVMGEVKCWTDEPAAGWLTIETIAVVEGQRGWGYGSEAVRLLEAEAKAARCRADVDARNGLGLYFWLRLGYRPAGPDEVPGRPPRGIITMIRATDAT